MHQFIYNNKNSLDFGLTVSGEDTWRKANPDIERKQIPGRNGDLLLDNRRYENVEITYRVGITKDFSAYYSAFSDFLLSSPTYHRLKDSYHPEVFRKAVPAKPLTPALTARQKEGQFDVTFSCMPQEFLKSGERTLIFTETGTIFNPTLYDAAPMLRVYGVGRVQVGEVIFKLTENDGYTDVDCELEDAYHGSENRNGNIELYGVSFPRLRPGRSWVIFGEGITRIEVNPRWWRL